MLFDTHCHLNDPELLDDLDKYVNNALAANVKKMLVVGYDYSSSKKAVEIAEKYNFIYASVGIHPCELLKATKEDYENLNTLLLNPKVVALGEVGLDYYWKDVDKKVQQEYFEYFIKLSKKYKKPLVIHSREAIEDTYEILKKNEEYLTTGVMHCYSSSLEMAKKFIDLGFYISLGGPVTFKNAKEPKRVVANIPLDKLLVETDSPYLAPHPYRGQKNEPAFVKIIVENIAQLLNKSYEEIADVTYNNAIKFFGVKND
ncbi:MAG: TatD family hydrolase [Bacilli bacterium]|nr:TatD family hydrolase [Bacilli bacterium]